MRLSREKTIRLSHKVLDYLVSSPDVDFVEDRDTIRNEIFNIMTALLKVEEQVDTEVRAKIASQKKEIFEASRSPKARLPTWSWFWMQTTNFSPGRSRAELPWVRRR